MTLSSCTILLQLSTFYVTPTSDIYTLSLHDALPISHLVRRERRSHLLLRPPDQVETRQRGLHQDDVRALVRSEEHTSELQSHSDLVCRLLLEKKKYK